MPDDVAAHVRGLLAHWRNAEDRRVLDAITGTSAVDSRPLDLDGMMAQFSSPWAFPPTASRVVSDSGAVKLLLAKAPITHAVDGSFSYLGMDFVIDDNLPPNTVRFVTSDGRVLQEFVMIEES